MEYDDAKRLERDLINDGYRQRVGGITIEERGEGHWIVLIYADSYLFLQN